MRALAKRLNALEGAGMFYSLGELLDHLGGVPLPAGKRVDPEMGASLNALPPVTR